MVWGGVGFGGLMFTFLELENTVDAMEEHGCGATICPPIEASKWSLPRFAEAKFVVNALQEKALNADITTNKTQNRPELTWSFINM